MSVDVARYLLARGIGQDEARTFRLGVAAEPFPGHGSYRGMLAIPYLDKDGRPLSIRFRCLVSGCEHEYHGKYNTVKDDPARMYGIDAIHWAKDEIHLCEGELDAIILRKLGLPSVAVPGAKAWAGRHRRMLAGFSRVWVWGDPDDAGAELVAKVTRQLRSAKALRLKADVTDSFLQFGGDYLLGLVGKS